MDGPSPSYADLEALLRSTARRAATLRLVMAIGVSLGLGSFFVGAAAARLAAHPAAGLRWAALWVSVGLVVLGPLVALLWRRPGSAALAGRALWPDPRLRSEVRSAVELRSLLQEDPTRGVSPDLIAAQARSTALRARGVDPRTLLPARASWLALGAGLTVAALVLAAGLGPLRPGFLVLKHLDAPTTVAAPRDPITGDIELTLLYPGHTRLPPRTISGTSGEVNAPLGTLVQLKTRADRPLAAASLVINGKPSPLSVAANRELSGSFVVREAGSYLFRFMNARGDVLAEGPPVSIAVQADAPPQVRIDKPASDLEVTPDALVPIEYRASDDYGISEVALVFRTPAGTKDERVVLRKDSGTPLHCEGAANLDLAPLHLSAGDRLSYTIEALDNDSVSGPKAGQAPSQTLRIFSAADHHREGLRQVRALWEKLITLLADRLDERTKLQTSSAILASSEGEPGPLAGLGGLEASDVAAFALCDEMTETSRRLRKDPAAPRDLALALAHVARRERERASTTASVREGVSRAVRNRPGVARASALSLGAVLEDEISGLEGDTLYLEALLDRQTLDDLVLMAKDMSSRRRDLANLLERYRKAPSPELRAAIAAQIARLRERIKDVFARMDELARGISDEHLNREALAQLAKDRDLAGGLDQVEKAIADGDLDEALKHLDQLAGALEYTVQALTKQRNLAGGASFPELAGQLRQLGQDLKDLAGKERALSEETARVREHYREEMKQRPQPAPADLAKLREAAAKASAHLEQVSEHVLYPGLLGADALATAREKTQTLQQALEVKDLEQALHAADQALRGAQEAEMSSRADAQLNFSPSPNLPSPAEQLAGARQHLGAAVPLLKGVRDALARLFPDPDRLLSPGDQKALERLSQKQGEVRSKLGGLYRQMADLQRSAPVLDPSAERHLDRAGSEMGAAQESLSGHRAGEALGKERSALSELDQLGESMKGQAGGGGEGLPMPFAMGESEGEGSAEDSEGYASEREKVVIPGADQYRVPDRFRRDLLDAMRQKAPQQFEEPVKKYYQEIVR